MVPLFRTLYDQSEIDNTRDDKKPVTILEYKKIKRGVDTVDQLVKTYSQNE